MATRLKVELDPVTVDNIPDHVPPELVRDLRWAKGDLPVTYDEPYQETEALFGPDVPPLMWTPDCIAGKPGVGAWVVTRYADIAKVYQDADLFSTEGVAAFQWMIGETWPCIPLGIDPPDHMKYRTMLNPYFSPKAIDELEPKIRASANALIDTFIDQGTTDFAYDFGRVYPVRVFMDLMGFPFSRFEQFLEWEFAILHSHDFEQATTALRGILAYLREFIAEQKANPGPDLGGKIVTSEVFGRPINDDEIIGTIFFLWLGGLDTVASSLAMMFRRLGMNMELQRVLRDDPSKIPDAVEEFLRVQPLVNSQRLVKKDFEMHGVTIKKGDWVMNLVTAGNFDPAEFKCPREVQIDRQANRHFTLAGGPHRCLGSHLARRELRVALEEWFRRAPPFRLAADDEKLVYPGLRSARNVQLVW
jgi:cytochrome P450